MASRLTEISLDCHDPDRLAAFWTGLLGWEVLHHEPGLVEIGPGGRDDAELLEAVRSGPVTGGDTTTRPTPSGPTGGRLRSRRRRSPRR